MGRFGSMKHDKNLLDMIMKYFTCWNKLIPLKHYSKEPVLEIQSCEPGAGTPHHKPKGFWVSVEDGWGWKDWCQQEEFRLDTFRVVYNIELATFSRVLHLRTPKDIQRFHFQFRVCDGQFMSYTYWRIDWAKVGQYYQGIIIAPYQWSCRWDFDLNWYSTWDCSSGCIWDASAIRKTYQTKEQQS